MLNVITDSFSSKLSLAELIMESGITTWSVIKFPDEDAVSAVPTSWLTEENQCYWPPYTKRQVIASIEKNDLSDQNWQKFKYIGFRNNAFDTYREANKKATKAVNCSDLESDNTFATSSRNRKIFRKTFSFSSVEESEESAIPSPPKLKKFKKAPPKEDTTSNKNTNIDFPSDEEPNLPETTSRPLDEHAQVSKSTKKPQKDSTRDLTQSSSMEICHDNKSNESKKIFNYFEQIVRKLNILQSLVMDVNNRLTVLETHYASPDNTESNPTSIFTKPENLPAITATDLVALENFLSNEEDMQNVVCFCTYLSNSKLSELLTKGVMNCFNPCDILYVNYLEQIVRKLNILQSLVMDVNNRLTVLETHYASPDNTESNPTSIFTKPENLPAITATDLVALENFLSNEEDMQNVVCFYTYREAIKGQRRPVNCSDLESRTTFCHLIKGIEKFLEKLLVFSSRGGVQGKCIRAAQIKKFKKAPPKEDTTSNKNTNIDFPSDEEPNLPETTSRPLDEHAQVSKSNKKPQKDSTRDLTQSNYLEQIVRKLNILQSLVMDVNNRLTVLGDSLASS
ncbi:hypothetical protein FQR65_LT18158 [Abscondita terminalis]|nr:hypothetical protein FQR65_LT18158 [Abscondita terminalis]